MLDHKGYIMIHLNPTNPPPAMLRPECYHTTLVRLAWSDPNREDEFIARLKDGVDAFWSIFRIYGLPTTLALGAPPWAKSWNFGYSEDSQFTDLALAVRHTGCVIAQNVEPDVVIHPRRELHISWS